MDIFKEEAIKEFKTRVMYIGAFVEGPLPKNDRIISEELPDKNPENGSHVTLFYLGNIPTISEELFDDIMKLPEGFTVTVQNAFQPSILIFFGIEVFPTIIYSL